MRTNQGHKRIENLKHAKLARTKIDMFKKCILCPKNYSKIHLYTCEVRNTCPGRKIAITLQNEYLKQNVVLSLFEGPNKTNHHKCGIYGQIFFISFLLRLFLI